MKILVIGGSGGIGSAIVSHLLALNPAGTVYGTYHSKKPDIEDSSLIWFKLDVTSEQQIKALAEQIPQLDMIINSVGMLQDSTHSPEKSINGFNAEFFEKNIAINVTPSICIAKYFSSHLNSKKQSWFVAISARVGSISDNKLGGWISYRTSKSALNMAMKTISIEWQYKLPNCCVFVFHPGTTDTELSKPFQKNVPENKLFSADFVARSLLELVAQLSPADSGKFYSYDGSEIPW